MNIITIKDGAVASVKAIAAGSTAILSDLAPRVGSLHDGGGIFRAPGDAVQIEGGIVVAVLAGQWAADQAGDGWRDAPPGTVSAGFVVAEDGALIAPPQPRDMAGEVAAHALALKVGAINALRTDGGAPYPATAEALAVVRDVYRDIVDDYNSAVAVGDSVTAEQTATVRLIRAGFTFFKAVDSAAAAIVAAGDAAEPVDADARWPALPSAG